MISDKDPYGMERFYEFIKHHLTKPLISKKIRRLKHYVVVNNKPVQELKEKLKQHENAFKMGGESARDVSKIFQAENMNELANRLSGKKRSMDANGGGDQPKRAKLEATENKSGVKPYKEACKTPILKSPKLKKVDMKAVKEQMRRKMEEKIKLDPEEEKYVEEECQWRCEQYSAVVKRLKRYFLRK